MQKANKEAGQCFEKAASIQADKLSEPDDAANTLTDAFKSYRKDEPEDAARCLEKAISHYTMKGNFRRAAGHKQNLAELYELELVDQKRAVEAYETAAGWYENDNAEAYVDSEYLFGNDKTDLNTASRTSCTSRSPTSRRWRVTTPSLSPTTSASHNRASTTT
jgi:alpha-soluble NSF attachment protein